MTQTVFEHVLVPGQVVRDPPFIVELWQVADKKAVYGFYVMTEDEVCDAVMLRATQLLRCSCVNPMLGSVFAAVRRSNDGVEQFVAYDPAQFYYKFA